MKARIVGMSPDLKTEGLIHVKGVLCELRNLGIGSVVFYNNNSWVKFSETELQDCLDNISMVMTGVELVFVSNGQFEEHSRHGK